MKKTIFYTELAYILGMALLSLGTATLVRMDLGISMVVAPAYLLHLKVSEIWPFFSFGMAEYVLQVVVLLTMMLLLRHIKWGYFLSILVAMAYGLVLDGAMALANLLPNDIGSLRMGFYGLGLAICAFAIALLFRSYLPPAAYELFVKELSAKFGWKVSRVKLCYDCMSCLVAVVMSLLLFGRLEAVGIGTVVGAVVNGPLIGLFDKILQNHFTFTDKFTLRRKLYE